MYRTVPVSAEVPASKISPHLLQQSVDMTHTVPVGHDDLARPPHKRIPSIVLYVVAAQQKRGLAWPSVSRIFQSLVGAFAVFPNYATGEHGERGVGD